MENEYDTISKLDTEVDMRSYTSEEVLGEKNIANITTADVMGMHFNSIEETENFYQIY